MPYVQPREEQDSPGLILADAVLFTLFTLGWIAIGFMRNRSLGWVRYLSSAFFAWRAAEAWVRVVRVTRGESPKQPPPLLLRDTFVARAGITAYFIGTLPHQRST